MKCSFCEEKLEKIDDNNICLNCVIQELSLEGIHTVKELCEKFNISEVQVINVLQVLLNEGRITGELYPEEKVFRSISPQKLIDELKFSEEKCKISDISEKLGVKTLFIYEFLSNAIKDKNLSGKIKDGYYLSQTYLKNLYLKKLKDFPLEHTDILEEELNRQTRLSNLKTKNKQKKTELKKD